MEDNMANEIKRQLDAALENVGPHVGILFETDVFDAFRVRNWIVLREIEIGGLFGAPERLPVYGTHAAIRVWGLPQPGFKVGRDAGVRPA